MISYIAHTFQLYSGCDKEIQDLFIGYVSKVAHYEVEHTVQAPYLSTQLALNTSFIRGSYSALWELNEVSDTARVIVKKISCILQLEQFSTQFHMR